MVLAQKLYESGKITYMRTDSVNLSDTARADIQNQISRQFGNNYYQPRNFKNKSESAQEAHEAIRPTYMENTTVDNADCRRLYDLIWKRTIACQMADAELEKTTAKIEISTNKEDLTASGEVLKFDGFLKAYREDRDEEEISDDEHEEGMLPPLSVGQQLPLKEMKATERFSRPSPRYTEASLVKKLEELGIGRPSTYAPTISTIQKRGYVEKRDKDGVRREFRILILKNDQISQLKDSENTGAEKAKLFPTDLGLVVTDFLKQYFDDIMDYHFTARIEEEFDEVAAGKMKWNSMIDDFYTPFKKDVENTIEKAERISGERDLGIDPATGKKVIARMGRYGPMVQIGDTSNTEDKARFAKLKNTQSIETISFEEAMDLFRLPRNLGLFEDKEVSVNIGRFGPYIAHDKKFYSLGKEFDPYTISLEEASPIIAEKRTAKEQRTIKVFEKEKIQLLRGPYGPYIKQGLRNYKIPKEKQETASDLTIEEVKDLIEVAKANPPKKVPRRKKG
jgi:DNA topoisomerase-1